MKRSKIRRNRHMKNDKPYPNEKMSEHDTVRSRTTGRLHEISMGVHGDGLVPKNPFVSQAQAGYMHEHPSILGKAGLKEWDQATKGKTLSKHVKHRST
jgi:hypothetical protein